MINVLFFASIREHFGQDRLSIEGIAALDSITSLIDHLEQQQKLDVSVLRKDNVIAALNQVKVGMSHPVADGDEVAFYPPVTGG